MIEVNETFVKQNYKVKPEDGIVIYATPDQFPNKLLPEKIDLDIIYEDDDIIVVNKQAGIVVHPGVGNYQGTLLNGLLYYYNLKQGKAAPDISRLGLVHRIDKETSGLLVLAKNNVSLANLSNQFANHSIHRRYHTLVWGDIKNDKGAIDAKIARDPRKRQNYSVQLDAENGKHAITHYKVLERLRYVTLVECNLETGRTHQIRVHMKHIGHTVFQDKRYGGDKVLKGIIHKRYYFFYHSVVKVILRQALHAKELGFIHPKTKKEMFFSSALPQDFEDCLQMWRSYKN